MNKVIEHVLSAIRQAKSVVVVLTTTTIEGATLNAASRVISSVQLDAKIAAVLRRGEQVFLAESVRKAGVYLISRETRKNLPAGFVPDPRTVAGVIIPTKEEKATEVTTVLPTPATTTTTAPRKGRRAAKTA